MKNKFDRVKTAAGQLGDMTSVAMNNLVNKILSPESDKGATERTFDNYKYAGKFGGEAPKEAAAKRAKWNEGAAEQKARNKTISHNEEIQEAKKADGLMGKDYRLVKKSKGKMTEQYENNEYGKGRADLDRMKLKDSANTLTAKTAKKIADTKTNSPKRRNAMRKIVKRLTTEE